MNCFDFSNFYSLFSVSRYNPSLSKTYKLDIEHCSKHSIRHSIDCADADVVDSYKRMADCWPRFSEEELRERYDGNLHPVFLMAKPNWKSTNKVWFQKRAIGKNTLGKAVRSLIENTSGIFFPDNYFYFFYILSLCFFKL